MSNFFVSINSSKINVQILNETELNFNDEKINYELIQISNDSFLLKLNNEIIELTIEKINSDQFKILANGFYHDITVRSALQEKAFKLLENSSVQTAHGTEVKAPMPGLILKIKKKVGEKVEPGESVVILEAMKMENDLKSPSSGLIKNIFVSEGSTVDKGTKLLSIE